jgi:hypothetical protein
MTQTSKPAADKNELSSRKMPDASAMRSPALQPTLRVI